MARGSNKSDDDKYTPKKDSPPPHKPGELVPRNGQYVTRGQEGSIPGSNKVKISTSNGKYGGPPREENWADKIIEKVFGDKG